MMFCVHCEPRRDVQLWHFHKVWRPFCFQILSGKRQNRAWHGADLESAYPNCVRTTACQILPKNALTSQKFQKWDLTNGLKLRCVFFLNLCLRVYQLNNK